MSCFFVKDRKVVGVVQNDPTPEYLDRFVEKVVEGEIEDGEFVVIDELIRCTICNRPFEGRAIFHSQWCTNNECIKELLDLTVHFDSNNEVTNDPTPEYLAKSESIWGGYHGVQLYKLEWFDKQSKMRTSLPKDDSLPFWVAYGAPFNKEGRSLGIERPAAAGSFGLNLRHGKMSEWRAGIFAATKAANK